MRQENIEDIYPLSPLQQGLLFHTLQAPGSGVYVVQLSCLLEGPLDEATFERACRTVVERHAVLRTAFVWEGLDEPVQVVCRQVELPFMGQDWRGLSPGCQVERAASYLRTDQARGFVVTEAPLVRLALFRLAEDRYQLVWTHHHLLLDGWSLHLLIREVFAYYEACRQGRNLHRPRPRRFRDYIGWLGQQSLPAAEAFWRSRLAGFSAPTPLRLPAPIQARPSAEIAGGMCQSDLPEAPTIALRALARQQQSTLNTLVQAAWAVALSRYSREEDVVFGIVSSGRPPALAGVESMIGVFVNTLPLRMRASRDHRLLPWLKELQAEQIEILAFEYSSLRQVQAWSEVPRGEPLFETLLDFTNYPLGIDSSEPGMSLRASEARFTERPSYPLAIIAAPGEVLSLKLLYDPLRLDGSTVSRLLDHLCGLLEEMSRRPQARVGELVWLREEERFQLLREWNDTAAAEPSGAIQELFWAQARRRPEALAVVSGAVRLSYGELAAWANRLGRHLRSLGVGRGSLVGVYLQRGWAMVPALLGILEAGGAYVPLDAGYPLARVRFILSALGIRWLVTQESLVERCEDLWVEVAELEHLVTLEPGAGGERWGLRLWTGSELAAVSAEPLAVWSGGEDLAYIIFTSGSTGTPKGVMVRHAPVVNLIGWVNETFGMDAEDQVLFVTSLCFDLSVYDIFGLLAAGGSIRVASEEEVRDPERLVLALSAEPITYWDSAPAALQQLVPFFPAAAVESRLRLVFLSGDWIPLRLPDQVRRVFSCARVIALGGATEATVWSNFHPVEQVEPGWASIPYGRPIRNARYHVLDAELEPCPIGVAGDLYIAGVCLASGYAGEAELTAWKFLPDPFREEPGGRMYRTGDRARTRGEGVLEFLGRLDHQVKLRGYRIELGEIESSLVEQEGVREAVVLVREDEPGQKRLVAYVVGSGEESLRREELRRSVAARLPEYMVPSAFVVLPALPVTSNGKLDRRALPPPEDVCRPRQGSAAPVSPVERGLAALWEEVLRVEGVGVHDNFFELGGDSILCIQIVSRARAAGLHFTTAQLFENPTIAELASVVGAAAGRAAAEEGPVVGPVPLTPIQRWLFEPELPDLHHFNQSVLLEVLTSLDPGRLARAVDHLLLHHDALRLRFEKTASGWQQAYVVPGGPAPFTLVDLSALPSPIRELSITRSAAELQAGAFELAQGPLLRAVLLRLGAAQSDRLLLVAHHLVVDGVSWRILLEDLQSAYEQLERAAEVRLSAKTTSYQEWAGRLQEHARSQALQRELELWISVPPGAGAALPVDFPGGSNRNDAAATVVVSLESEETRALLQEVSEAYLTQINDVLLAALCEALSCWAVSPGLLVDLEGHGREEIFEGLDLSRTVGWFTAIFPVWLDPGDSREPGARLKAVKECLRRIPSRGVGYGLLRYLGPEAAAARLRAAVQAEVGFNYLGQLDQALPPSSPFRPATESSGEGRSPRQPRRYLLEVSCSVLQGRLRITWSYSERLHRRSTVEALAQRFLAALRDLIAHCRSELAGGRTPSDFPLVALDQETLDRLVGNGREVEDLYPLSPLQQGMLFHALQDPGAGVYCQQLVCHVEGEVDPDALEKAWQQALSRHTILRTAFAWDDLAEPLQIVYRRVGISLQRIDWSGLPEPQREERFSSWLQRDRAEGFDPSQAPLMRLCLIHLGERDDRFVWTHHHLLLDGWSLPLLYREVFATYEAFRQQRGVDAGRPRPYRDYIEWLLRQDLGRAESFWREYLQGFSASTVLTSTPRARQTLWKFGRAAALLSSDATAALHSLGRRGQLTLNTLAQGAWGLLLGRYLGRDDVAFGSVVAGRPPDLPDAETILGPFINTLPVRVRLPRRESLLPWLGRLQSEQIALRQYEFSPLRRVQEWSRAAREQPLFDTLLVFENYPVDQSLRQQAETLQIREVVFEERTSYPLALAVVPGRELSLQVVYDRASFDAPFVARAVAHLAHLLEEIASGDRSLEELSLMSAAERHQVLTEWNDRPADYDGEVCLHELFERQVERTPDEVALVSAEKALTYGQLDARADRLARHLRSLGIVTGARVALCVERSSEMVVAILGILKAGAAYVPLDPGYPQERLAFMLADSGAPVLLAQERCLDHLPSSPGTRVVQLDRPWEDPAREQGRRLDGGAGPDDLAYVIYTSGSSGRPKGVMISHRAIANRLLWMQSAFPLTPADRLLQKTPVSFDASVWEIFLPLATGAKLVLARPDGHKDSAYMVQALADHGITVLQLVPSMLQVLVEEIGLESCSSLRRVFGGGEALPGQLQQRLAERLGIELHNLYGPTEAAIDASCRPCRADDVRLVTPIGRPLPRLRIFLLDDGLQPAPIGLPGELHIGGVNLAWGYLSRPDLTAEKFVPDPYREGGERLYKTGDLARFLPDGEIEYLGRTDQQVKVRGFRIELGEIEAALLSHPRVRQAAVIAREDHPGDRRLVGYVVPLAAPGAEPASDALGRELREHLAGRLPEYMVPTVFVALEGLPFTPNGKLDRAALPAPERPRPAGGLLPPRTPTEERVARIWCEVLVLDAVGIEESFLELGGNSLVAMRLVSRLRRSFGVEVPLRTLFECSTVAGLAQFIDHEQLERATEADEETLAYLLAEVEGLAEEDVSLLLSIEDGRVERANKPED